VPRRIGVLDLAAPPGAERRDRTAPVVRDPARPDGRRPGRARCGDRAARSSGFEGRFRGRDRAAAARRAGDFRAARRGRSQAPRDRVDARHHERYIEAAVAPGAHADAQTPGWVMTHEEQWTDKLSDFLDGELTPDERAAVEAHLQGCAACATVLEELRQ